MVLSTDFLYSKNGLGKLPLTYLHQIYLLNQWLSVRVFQVYQRIILVVFGVVDEPLAACINSLFYCLYLYFIRNLSFAKYFSSQIISFWNNF